MKRTLLFLIVIALAAIFLFSLQKPNQSSTETPKTLSKLKSETADQPEPPKPPAQTTIVAVGDIMLSRNVGAKIRAKDDPTAPFAETVDILKNADITFGNLESPFLDKGSPVTAGMVFKAEPNTIDGLKFAGFDVVSLANNHFGDRGQDGMNYTFQHLKDNGLEYIGAGQNETKARQAKIITRHGLRFAFLAYADRSSMTPEASKATADKPGVAWLEADILKKDIKEAKQKTDVVIVSLHWGTEYQKIPSASQKEMGQLAIDSGASLVLGHHPHVVQPNEKYQDGYIFYSLGNFVFDQMWSEATRHGEIAKIYFKDNKIDRVETIPITIYDYYQPRPD